MPQLRPDYATRGDLGAQARIHLNAALARNALDMKGDPECIPGCEGAIEGSATVEISARLRRQAARIRFFSIPPEFAWPSLSHSFTTY
jgi:hypothetical protein